MSSPPQIPQEVEELLLQTLHFANFLSLPPISATTEAQYLMNEVDYISRKVLKTLDKHSSNNHNVSDAPTISPKLNAKSSTKNVKNAAVVVVEETIVGSEPNSPSSDQQQKALKIIIDAIKTTREKAIQSIIDARKESATKSGVTFIPNENDEKDKNKQQSVDDIFINNQQQQHNNDDWWNNNNNSNDDGKVLLQQQQRDVPEFPSFPANINRSIVQQIQDARTKLSSTSSNQQRKGTSSSSTGIITFNKYAEGPKVTNNNEQQQQQPTTASAAKVPQFENLLQNLPPQLQNNPMAKSILENFSSQLKDVAVSNSSSPGNNTGIMNSFMNTMMSLMGSSNNAGSNSSSSSTTNVLGLPRPQQQPVNSTSTPTTTTNRNVYQRPHQQNALSLPVPTTFSFSEDVPATEQHHQAVRRERED